jgi:hypothetical protein
MKSSGIQLFAPQTFDEPKHSAVSVVRRGALVSVEGHNYSALPVIQTGLCLTGQHYDIIRTDAGAGRPIVVCEYILDARTSNKLKK